MGRRADRGDHAAGGLGVALLGRVISFSIGNSPLVIPFAVGKQQHLTTKDTKDAGRSDIK